MEREIRLMRMLTGEGMVSLFGVFEDDARKSLVMEYCSGGDLFKYLLLRGGHLDEHWVCTEVSDFSSHRALPAMFRDQQFQIMPTCATTSAFSLQSTKRSP